MSTRGPREQPRMWPPGLQPAAIALARTARTDGIVIAVLAGMPSITPIHTTENVAPSREHGNPRSPSPLSVSRDTSGDIMVPAGVSYDEAIVAVQKQLVGRALRQSG